MQKMDLVYYFYYHGEEEFANKMDSIFGERNFDAFMEVFQQEKNERLPEDAVLYIGDNFYINVPITDRDVFENLTHFESEWG